MVAWVRRHQVTLGPFSAQEFSKRMFHLRKPTKFQLARLHADHQNVGYSYDQQGITEGNAPAGFVTDHNRVELGRDPQTFERAKAAIAGWQMLQLGWVEPCFPQAAVQPGELVGTLAAAMGLWVTNVCRIVYVIDETDRYGFAYGTLVGHAELGEERFLIERDTDGRVYYDILAHSRPGRLITRLGYPYVRRLQRRFARDSKRVMAERLE